MWKLWNIQSCTVDNCVNSYSGAVGHLPRCRHHEVGPGILIMKGSCTLIVKWWSHAPIQVDFCTWSKSWREWSTSPPPAWPAGPVGKVLFILETISIFSLTFVTPSTTMSGLFYQSTPSSLWPFSTPSPTTYCYVNLLHLNFSDLLHLQFDLCLHHHTLCMV